MKIKRVWKVFSCLSGSRQLLSAFVVPSQKYRKGAWNLPMRGCGPMAVFGTRRDAEAFINDSALRIIECAAVVVDDYALYNRHRSLGPDGYPRGTILCAAIYIPEDGTEPPGGAWEYEGEET